MWKTYLANYTLAVTPILVPLIVGLGVKKVMPRIPTVWLPIIATLLGPALDFLQSLASGSTLNPLQAALYAAAGIGLREIVDQVKRALVPNGGSK